MVGLSFLLSHLIYYGLTVTNIKIKLIVTQFMSFQTVSQTFYFDYLLRNSGILKRAIWYESK